MLAHPQRSNETLWTRRRRRGLRTTLAPLSSPLLHWETGTILRSQPQPMGGKTIASWLLMRTPPHIKYRAMGSDSVVPVIGMSTVVMISTICPISVRFRRVRNWLAARCSRRRDTMIWKNKTTRVRLTSKYLSAATSNRRPRESSQVLWNRSEKKMDSVTACLG